MTIIGEVRMRSGRKFAVGVDGKMNAVYWLDGREPTAWQGQEVTCCVCCGETVVCPTICGSVQGW